MKTAALLVLAASLAVLPAVAPVTAVAGDGMSLTGFPSAAVAANGTSATIPFDVVVTLGQSSCATSQGAITLSPSAALNGTIGTAAAQINPKSDSISLGATDTIAGSKQYTKHFTLTVTSTSPMAANVSVQVKVTATPPTCTVPQTQTQLSDATGDVKVQFKPLDAGTSDNSNEQPVPGFGIPALVLAVVALAVALRRKA